jgi:hypothetical protein
MSHPNRARALAAALALMGCLGALAGCGDDAKTGSTAADEPAADVSTSTGSPSAGSEETGNTDVPHITASEGLPEGFPSDDVPLLHEKVLTGSAGGPDGEFDWSVVLESSRAVSDVAANLRKDFADAGYTAGPGNEFGDLSVMQFKGAKYDVAVTAARSESHVIITYVVKDAG